MAQEGRRDFIKHSFFKVSPEWRRLPPVERDHSKKQFAEVVAEFSGRLAMASYSLVGIRGDVDFMIWSVSPSLEAVNELLAQPNRTKLGKFLSMPHSYLSMTRRSPYVERHQHGGQEGTAATMRIIGRKYLFVYPFVKTHGWYYLSQEERQTMMDEHFTIGHRYPSVKTSTGYSFGVDGQEFVLGFETDDPPSFLELVTELRGAEARRYTLRDTPSFTCINKPMRACLDDLG
jgi:chlorite dismutase